MYLKEYQKQTLETLQKYLKACRLIGPAEAYKVITHDQEQKARLGRYLQDYKPVEFSSDIPYICLRLPTGGGKTILAARSIKIARDSWVEKEYPTVLWLVPTNTIRQQTVEALKNPRHPYRQQMDKAFEGRVRVFDIGDFENIRPTDLRDHLTVIVGTIQTLRVDQTEGRKVYAHNENLEPHFSSLPKNIEGLEKKEDTNNIKFSLANLLHIAHPIMIVDEAHNAVTGLSRVMQERIAPSCIIEFTATPRLNSNILHSVTAQELKDEDMIKLPIVLAEHPNWQSAVDGAIQRRQELENVAEKDKSYIRPIVLFQAQKKNEEVTVDALKDYLIETSGIDKNKVAIATGDQRDLDGIDLFDPKCRIEYVITVEALKEGWDCSFAYIFCSVSRIKSASAVEQLLGRVLRMPYAESRSQPELNRAYAHVSEPSFSEAATALKDKLVAMGFDENEAALNIERERIEEGLPLEGGLFGSSPSHEPKLTDTVDYAPDIHGLSDQDQKAITIEEKEDGKFEVTVTGHISDEALDLISKAMPETKKKTFEEKAKEHKKKVEQELSPAARGVSFKIPKLMAEIQGELEFADNEIFDEFSDWSLLDYPAKLDEKAFNIHEESHTFEIDLDGQKLAISYASPEETLSLDIEIEEWTDNNLALALDKLIGDIRFNQSEKLKWCLDHISYLHNERKIPLSSLWRAKFALARKLQERIRDIKAKEAEKAYQRYLFSPEAKPLISFDNTFIFFEGMYDGQKPYRGQFTFKKHYLEMVPFIDGGDQGEECRCAMAIDSLPEIKHWLRNVSKHPASFKLPRAQGWTYPDFVAELNDGRFLVVEYKGADRYTADAAREARLIGELWEKSMNGSGLYLMAVKESEGKSVREQIQRKISCNVASTKISEGV